MKLEPRDQKLVEILSASDPTIQTHVQAAAEVQAAVRALGVRLSLGEILVDRGWLPSSAFLAACQQAARLRIGLVDRSSMRHLNVTPQEDQHVVQVAINYGLLPQADRDRAAEVQTAIAAHGSAPLLAKVLADLGLLDVEVYEGLLHYLRRFQAQSRGEDVRSLPTYFDEEDLALGLVGLERRYLEKIQFERALKIKYRFRKAKIERNLVEICYEQGALDRKRVETMVPMAQDRLNPPREIPIRYVRLSPQAIHFLGQELQGGRLTNPSYMPAALEAQRVLHDNGIERPLAQVLVDLGAADPAVLVEAESRFPAAEPTSPSVRDGRSSGPRQAVAGEARPPSGRRRGAERGRRGAADRERGGRGRRR